MKSPSEAQRRIFQDWNEYESDSSGGKNSLPQRRGDSMLTYISPTDI